MESSCTQDWINILGNEKETRNHGWQIIDRDCIGNVFDAYISEIISRIALIISARNSSSNA